MRVIYTLLILIFTHSLHAQLSGSYTIGGTSPDYSSVAQAVDSLNAKGVNGAVTFNIRSGNYNAQFTIENVSGASSTNTIRFRPDPAATGSVTIQYNNATSSDNYVIRFKSAKYIQFDSLTIGNVSTGSFGTVIRFTDTCEYIGFNGNTIQGSQNFNTSQNMSLIWDERGTNQQSQHITFENNEILNGSYAFYIYGASSSTSLQQDGWVIKNNNIDGWGYYAIYSYYNKNIEIVNNTITSGRFVSSSARGVWLYYNSVPTFSGNKYYNGSTNSGYGVYMFASSGLFNDRGDISNNFIHVLGATYGLYMSACNYSDVYFNTIKVDGGTAPTVAYLNLSSTSEFKNNILASMGATGTVMNSVGSTLRPDYNNYYSASGPVTPVGANSVSVDPMFVSSTDLHINNVQLNGVAQTITGITEDVDGETRNSNTDIGADEFDPDSLDAAALSLKEVYCSGQNNIEFDVLNFGLDTIKTMKIRLGISVNGRPFQYQTVSFNGSLPSGISRIINLRNYNFNSDSTYRITARIDSVNGLLDTVTGNNALTTGTFGTAISGVNTIGGANPDFTDFTAAVARLRSSGICGNTIFRVRQGSYNQTLTFGAIKGVSLSDTIVFEADTGLTAKPILYSSTGNTITFQDNQGITFRNIAIHNNNSNGAVLMFRRDNRMIRLDSCELRADTSSRPGSNSRVIMNNRNEKLSSLVVSNSDIRGGYYSIYVYGNSTSDLDSNFTLLNNRIYDWYQYGIYSWYQNGSKIIGNTIEDKDVVAFRYGFYSYYGYSSEFSKNKLIFSHTTSGYGVYLVAYSGRSNSDKGSFNNNFISSHYENSTLTDLLYSSSSNYVDYYFNSFYLKTNSATSNAVEMRSPRNSNFRNNNIHADMPGTAYNRTGTFVSTHNNVYAPGGTPSNVNLGPSDVSINPFFKSPDDLHVKSIFVNGKGIRINGVTDDIDNETRATVPDMGADEFEVDSNDIAIASLISPSPGRCGADSQLVRVLVLNNGTQAQTTFPISVQFFGAFNGTVSTTYNGSLGSAKYDTVDVGYINTKTGGLLTALIYSGLNTDTYRENDTMIVDRINVDRVPSVKTFTSPIVVCDGIDSVITSGARAKRVEWYDALSNGNLLHVGDSFRVNISSADTLYVRASDNYSSTIGDDSPYGTSKTTLTWTNPTFNQGLRFDVKRPLVIDTVTVHPTDSGTMIVTVRDKDNNIVATKRDTVFPMAGSKVFLGFKIPPGSDYRISAAGSAFGKNPNTSGLEYHYQANYPYRDSDTSMIITSDLNGANFYYYFFYDFKISVEGCDAGTSMIPISTRPTPSLDLGNDTGYCTGSSINLVANATTAGVSRYVWDNNSTNTIRNITTKGSYSVTATGVNGCVINDTIEVKEIPQPTMSWNTKRYCDNEGNVQLTSGIKYGGTYTGTGIVGGTHFNTGLGVGTYNLNYTYSDGMGCFGQTSGAIIIDAAPTATMPTIPDMCQTNAAYTLTAGTPTPGYFFDDENLVGFGTYTPRFAGLDTVYYVGVAQNSCADTAFQSFNVKPAPQIVITAVDTMCENESAATLAATPTGGVFSGTGVTGSSFDPSVPGVGAQQVYYEAWNPNGCTTKVAKTIHVLEKPAITFNSLLDVCEGTGDYKIVRGLPAGGMLTGNFVDNVTSVFDVDAAGAGTHPIGYAYTGRNGCSNEVTQNLVVKPQPTVNLGGDQQICGNNTLKLSAGNSGAQYLWSTNATSSNIIVSRSGNYSVEVNLNGCVSSDSVTVSYEAICVGLEELAVYGGVSVYPIPARDMVTISFDNKLSAELRVTLLDSKGNLVWEDNNISSDELQIDVSSFASGVYFLRLIGAENVAQSRISIQH